MSISSAPPFIESWISGPNSTQFYSRTYTPINNPKAVVIFLHGFAEHIARYTDFHLQLCKHDISVFTIDQRGFGKTALDTDGHRSKDSAYGKTSWTEQMKDIAWAVEHARKTFPNVPTFLMGHSMGGAEVLGFVTQDSYLSVTPLSGVISTSPLILQTKPASKSLRWIGGIASHLLPDKLIPADVNAAHLSHDNAVNEAYLKDTLVKHFGSLRGLHDMLSMGEALLEVFHKNWPNGLPLFIAHGTDDKITSYQASQAFHDKISGVDKEIKLFEAGFHELHNEPNGVKEQLLADIVVFIEAHLLSGRELNAGPEERSKM